MKKYYARKENKEMMYTYKTENPKTKRRLMISLNTDVDINDFSIQLKKLYSSAEIIKKPVRIDNLLRASESSLEFWNNDIDDEVWNNV